MQHIKVSESNFNSVLDTVVQNLPQVRRLSSCSCLIILHLVLPNSRLFCNVSFPLLVASKIPPTEQGKRVFVLITSTTSPDGKKWCGDCDVGKKYRLVVIHGLRSINHPLLRIIPSCCVLITLS